MNSKKTVFRRHSLQHGKNPIGKHLHFRGPGLFRVVKIYYIGHAAFQCGQDFNIRWIHGDIVFADKIEATEQQIVDIQGTFANRMKTVFSSFYDTILLLSFFLFPEMNGLSKIPKPPLEGNQVKPVFRGKIPAETVDFQSGTDAPLHGPGLSARRRGHKYRPYPIDHGPRIR
jgi:hypothetical protein